MKQSDANMLRGAADMMFETMWDDGNWVYQWIEDLLIKTEGMDKIEAQKEANRIGDLRFHVRASFTVSRESL